MSKTVGRYGSGCMVKFACPSLMAHSSIGSEEDRGIMGGISEEGMRWPGRWKEEMDGLVDRGGEGIGVVIKSI